jgi:ribonucleotide reductase beta subunit family protein with ferritin-like domain
LTSDIQTLKENLEPVRETPVVAAAESQIEPLLQESPGQYVIFPINHEDMWHMYKSLVDNFWSVTETLQEMDKLALNIDETQFMKYFSSIFASPHSQGLVNENFAEELCKLIQVTEAKFFYGHQLFVQNIHYEMYNKLLDKFVTTKDEK